MSTDPLHDAQKRAFRYWYLDGTFEFSLGGMCLLLAAYFYAEFLLRATWIGPMMIAVFLLVMIGGGFLINRLVMAFKERLTFPRTGYVAFRRAQGPAYWKRMVLLGALSAATAFLLVWVVMNQPAGFDWTAAATGLIFGAVVVYLGIHFGIARFFVYAAISLTLGAITGWLNWPENLGLIAFYGLSGLGLLLMGTFHLWKYLRENPMPAEESHDK
ncbi:MAG: hypothetical protein N2117_04005 [Anaerolineales bacterium]|nr:hypothetical protein [Anaerolineales bacterium]MCX7754394.1 hypothetical protein [Anaerolineales bacterium]MDW8277916.1 hypothetical protein [Anaerolineales bacterium]